jgi:FAD dependent oxidoreductase
MHHLFSIILFIFISNPLMIIGQDIIRLNTDVCIVGAGSGGIGAALAASRAGSEVILIEKQNRVGGTSTLAFVNNWEPGTGDHYAFEIYTRIKKSSGAIAISKSVHKYKNEEPYGISETDLDGNYNQTLRRSDLTLHKGVVFGFEEFDTTVRQMLQETGKCKLLLNTSFTRAVSTNKQVKVIEAHSLSGEKYSISAKIFIDCTGGAILCRNLGCESMIGAEAKAKFNEPSAPEVSNNNLNAISLCYQIRKSDNPIIAKPAPAKTFNYHLVAVKYDIPGKDNIKSINPLGILNGSELIRLGYDSTYMLAKKIVDDHWAKLQKYPHFKDYEFLCYAPMLGIRESYRIVGEYVLNQNDLLAGYKNQLQKDIITLADHPMDVHGKNSKLSTLPDAYGIPYRCLIPKGWSNLMVACRGASFSQLAASSCRLSRTILALGHAAGYAASIASEENIPVLNVPVERIQAEMNLTLRPKEDMNANPLPIMTFLGNK